MQLYVADYLGDTRHLAPVLMPFGALCNGYEAVMRRAA